MTKEPTCYTKNELIAFLEDLEGNPKILLSSDDEGNSFHPFTGNYIDDFSNGEPVLILYPGWGHIETDEEK